MSKLIILRGPSGSGKSTVAKLLFEKVQGRVALIEQDYYRFMFKPAGDGGKLHSTTTHQMIKSDVLIALENGYDVILEGILGEKSYSKVFEDIFAKHPEENYIYYFDISIEETIRRHKTRTVRDPGFTPEDMKSWFPAAHRSNHKFEKVIPEESSARDSAEFIVQTSALGV